MNKKKFNHQLIIAICIASFSSMLFMSHCNSSGQPSCYESDCYGMPRLAVGIIPYDDSHSCGDISEILFKDSEGDIFSNHPSNLDEEASVCGCPTRPPYTDGMIWSACSTYGPAVKWSDVTISLDAQRTSTQRIELAEHNYCGEDIAYVLVTLHEDKAPTFGEVMYVSPCETGGL
ncbi:MAG: hypothetical protein QNJ97_28865 [Myxococcota bacterium]|nr:hypothetical protein [Myxococcota bacterium]